MVYRFWFSYCHDELRTMVDDLGKDYKIALPYAVGVG